MAGGGFSLKMERGGGIRGGDRHSKEVCREGEGGGIFVSRPKFPPRLLSVKNLVAPYCAIPRDYLRRCALWGVWCLNMPIGCDPPSPFSERFPLGEHAKWRCHTSPLKMDISAILARYPMKTRQTGAIPPSAILSRKGIARYGGGYLALGRQGQE